MPHDHGQWSLQCRIAASQVDRRETAPPRVAASSRACPLNQPPRQTLLTLHC